MWTAPFWTSCSADDRMFSDNPLLPGAEPFM